MRVVEESELGRLDLELPQPLLRVPVGEVGDSARKAGSRLGDLSLCTVILFKRVSETGNTRG